MAGKFTHLHVHSHYSLLDGLPKIDELLNYAKELGMESLALTDHGVLYGAVEFYKKAKAAGIKPILGCEIYLAFEDMLQRRPNIDDKKYHLILLVKNEQGYKNLVKLTTKAHLEGFYYKPRVDEKTLAEHSEGLIALSACLQGKIPRLIIAGKINQAKEQALKYQQIFGKENFYLEIQNHPGLKEQGKANQAMIEIARELQIPIVATNDTHYLKPEDAEAQDILMLINTGSKSDDPERLTMKADDFSLRTPEQMRDFCREFPEAIENTQKIAEACNFDFNLGQTQLPYFQTPQKQDPDDYLKELCLNGFNDERKKVKDKKTAQDRLEYELAVIKQTGFAPYFLIVQDFVKWAKENRIVVGPGRGSVGGSLVAYLLDITDVEPLKHDLLFERFLNPQRVSMPDIDLDFTDRRRDEVINYVAGKYGRNRVAQIITFGTMASRAAIRDVGRAMGLAYGFCDQAAKMIPFGMGLAECLNKVAEFRQLYETDEQAKKLIDFSIKLEGVARHASTHACGVVISKEPLDALVPLQFPTQSDQTVVTQYEMHAIEDLGLLKMDFLGLKNLTIIEDTLARIYKVQNKSLDLATIPEDDKKTFKILQDGQTTSVFQLESSGMKRYLKELKPSSFADIATMVALYRPGPIELIPEYIARKHRRKQVEYIHPSLQTILEPTYGLPVFQEQIMQIARELAGFSLAEADVLRKAIGKKIRALLDAQKEKFIAGCLKNNVPQKIAEQVFAWIEPHASYSFNKSHAVAYAMIAYRTAYLKAHFPVEFMSAVLTSEKADVERIAFLIDECKSIGIDVLPPDINESYRNFSVVPEENKIRFGLLAIKNVGENIVEAIIKERSGAGPFKNFSDFASRIQTRDFNKKSLESLIKTGVFDKFEDRNRLLGNLEEILAFNRDLRKEKTQGQKSLFDESQFAFPTLKLKNAPPLSEDQKLMWEKELLGLFISSHPLKNIQNIVQQKALPIKRLRESLFNCSIRIAGIISSIKKIITKKGQPMLFMRIEDLTDKAEIIVFPGILEQKPTLFQENKIVFVTGRVDSGLSAEIPKLICEDIEEILEA